MLGVQPPMDQWRLHLDPGQNGMYHQHLLSTGSPCTGHTVIFSCTSKGPPNLGWLQCLQNWPDVGQCSRWWGGVRTGQSHAVSLCEEAQVLGPLEWVGQWQPALWP